jgi:hypothetical protein
VCVGLLQKATFQTVRATAHSKLLRLHVTTLQDVISNVELHVFCYGRDHVLQDLNCYGRDRVLQDLNSLFTEHRIRLPVQQRFVD